MKRLRPLLILALLLAPLWSVFAGNAPMPAPSAPLKGLAQLNWTTEGNNDRARLRVSQWYAWGMNACGGVYTNCTPMNRNWEVSAQTICPPWLLLGNEPTNAEPAGHPIAASDAASVTLQIEALCPSMKIVAGNIHINNGDGQEAKDWLTAYLAAYKLQSGHAYAHTLGIHCYSQFADQCLARINEVTTLLWNKGYTGNYWLTEFAMYGLEPYTNSGAELKRFLDKAPLQFPRIRRYYAWTNRSDPNCCSGWPFEMVNGDNTLTAMGTVYRNWVPPVPPPVIPPRQVYLPVVALLPLAALSVALTWRAARKSETW